MRCLVVISQLISVTTYMYVSVDVNVTVGLSVSYDSLVLVIKSERAFII